MFSLWFGWTREYALNQVLSARALLDAQGEILEGMASGAALNKTAEGIALLVEKLVPPAMCAIVLVHHDGLHLKPIAAPSLPEYYFTTMDGVRVAPDCGSTGTAAWRREPVLVAETATDPLWKNLRDFADICGIRASWALPILHDDETVLGVLSLYYREPHEPDDWDWSALNSCIKLVRLALTAHRREQQLTASETRWRIGAEALGLGTFDIDFETGIDQWSLAMRQILGVGDDVPANLATFMERIHPDDRQEFLARHPQAPQPQRSSRWRKEFRIRRADDGQERIVLSKGCIIAGSDGTPLRAVGMLHDVTDHRRHEQELEKAKADAEDANRAKSRFLASMSHELRTPLNAIIGFSDMIRSHVFGPLTPPRYEDYVEDIHKSGTHLLSLINDVLDMAKIEAQKFELVRAPVSLEHLTDGALRLVRPQARAKRLDLVLDLDAGLTLNADERALRQALVNLLSNAVKFTNSGGTVRLFAKQRADGRLDLGVEDTGAGMDADGIATALEPFGQIQMDVTAERTGTGLGLPLAKAMVESHGASFHIESALGIGTKIWGEFPAADVTVQTRNAG